MAGTVSGPGLSSRAEQRGRAWGQNAPIVWFAPMR